MNFMNSECSSGCESGWTNYLEQSFLSANPSNKKKGFRDANKVKRGKQKVEEEEDLSMVSDASSGPPHEDVNGGSQLVFHEYTATQGEGLALNKNGGQTQRHRNKEQRRRLQVHEDDDTATSPFINYSKNNKNQAPIGFSATQFEGGVGSNFQGHFGFLQSSSPSANQIQSNQWF